MIKKVEETVEILKDGTGFYEAEAYTLEDDTLVMWERESQSWKDSKGNTYTAVTMGNIIGFNRRDTLTEAQKRMLSGTSEGKLYIEYNERLGGDPIEPVALKDGETVERMYKECLQVGVCWEEYLSCYIEDNEVNVVFW